MGYRLFVLVPAVEIAADMLHPRIGWNLGRLVEHLRTASEYVAITGIAGVGKTRLAARLASTPECRLVSASIGRANCCAVGPRSG